MKIYIAGPYSSDPEANTIKAINVAERVANIGHTPFVPHFTHYWEILHHHDYEFWMKQDFEWLKCCDGLLRLEGESSGADREEKWALQHGIVIFHSIPEIITYTLGFGQYMEPKIK